MASVCVLGCGLLGPAALGEAPARLRTAGRLDMVVSTSLFRSVNRNDAVPAIRTWAGLIGRKRGFQFEPEVHIADDIGEIRKLVLAGASGVLALDAQEYFHLADLKTIDPKFSAARGADANESRYLLVSRAESDTASLPALRNKTLLVHASTAANLGLVWIESLLAAGRLEPARAYFSSLEVTSKSSSALLPVFFGRADAAVVDKGSFEVSKEMNPQLGRKLRVLNASPVLTEAVICLFGRQIVFRDELLLAIRDLHLDVEGKQILMVLRFSQFVPLSTAALEQSRQLLLRHGAPAPPVRRVLVSGETPGDGGSIARGRVP